MSRSKQQKESLSKKLREVFYILWEQNHEGFDNFDKYYNNKMLKLVNHYKKLIK